jgi:hypothetical protein
MKKNNKSGKLPIIGNLKKGFRAYIIAVLSVMLLLVFCMTAYAVDDPIEVINNLSDFIFGLIRAIGIIMLGFGVVQVGMSLSSHDAQQRSTGFLALGGGIIITFAKEILTLITG